MAMATTARGQDPTAVADGETLQGSRLAGAMAVFRGIPYAAPPIGELRWRAPVRRPAGSGTRSATAFGPVCAQTDRLLAWERNIATVFGTESKLDPKPLNPNEDCLFLNVWTSNLGRGRPGQPVMVWIHGGSNMNGEGSSAWYDGTNLAAKGVIVVTINYRLGVFGFLGHPALSAESPQRVSGNYGLLDQLEALRWVQRNIAAFGGDPNRVTVFGESAGSIDIVHLMASPLAKGLFHRAIAQSGAPMLPMGALKGAEQNGIRVAKTLNADSANPLGRMRAASTQDVMAAADKLGPLAQLANPVVDGWVLPEMTLKAFTTGKQLPVPLLIGSNALEMTTLRGYLPRVEPTVEGFQKWAGQFFGAAGPKLLERYPVGSASEVEPRLLEVATDWLFTCPARIAARSMAMAGSPAYRYHFTRVLPGGQSLGAYHGMEIVYAFGNRLPWMPREPVDEKLSATMMEYWTRFAATGDPNGGDHPSWPKYTAETDQVLELGPTVRVVTGLKKEVCDLIEGPR
jgi:para-nitrobenzyl esterase